MPQVIQRTKTKGGHKSYRCGACGENVEPGQAYYTWAFRYGSRHFQHVLCGYPKRSQLTQSMMADVYDALDDAERAVAEWDGEEVSDLGSILQDAAQSVRDVSVLYAEAAEHFGGQGENQDRADELESFASDLEYVSFEDKPEQEEGQSEDEYESELETWRDEQRDEAQSVLGQCPY